MDQVYKEYALPVYKYLLTLTKDPDLAEELTAETFYRAMGKYKEFRGDSKVLSWLCQISYSLDIEGADELTHLVEGTGVFSKEELEKDIQESYYFLSLKNTIFHSPKNSVRTEWRIIDLTQKLEDEFSVETYGKILTRDVKKAYYEGRDENDRILIWEEGMEILPAPQEIEEFVVVEDRWISESYKRKK